MTRYSFGGELTHTVATVGTANALVLAPSASVAFYGSAGGSAVTDFVLWNTATSAYDIAVTEVAATSGGTLPRFQGPDGATELWTQDGGGYWLRLKSYDAVPAIQASVDAISQELGPSPQGASATVAERLTAIEGSIATGAGSPGPAGAETVVLGSAADTDVAVTGNVYLPFVAPVDMTIQSPVVVALLGGAASGDTVFDVEMSTSGIGGTFSSIFASSLPKVAAGRRESDATTSGTPSVTALPAFGALRLKVSSASTGAGATTWRTPGSAGGAATATVNNLVRPVPTGVAAGDLLTDIVFLAAASTNVPAWPVTPAWSVYGAPAFPAGAPDSTFGPFLMYLATRPAVASESTSSQVNFGLTTAVMSTLALSAATLVTPTTANWSLNTTTTSTSAATPSGLTTPAANCVVVHIAMPRWTSTSGPSTVSWSNSLATDTQAQTAKSASQNVGIAITHEVQATAGAITPRTASWTNQARSVTATLVFQPSSGTAPTGPKGYIRVKSA